MSKKKFILLVALFGFSPMSTDIYLVSMPVIVKVFSTTAAKVQLTLSLFFIGFATSQFIWGPLADRFGRKPVMLFGLVLYMVGSLLCAIATSIDALIFFRLIQAIGGASGVVISVAMLRDLYQNRDATPAIGMMMSIMILAPIVSPVIGSILLSYFSWRANFVFLLGYSLILFIAMMKTEETRPAHLAIVKIPALLKSYGTFLKNPFFIVITLSTSAIFAGLFAFAASAPFLYIDTFSLSYNQFGVVFACNSLGLLISAQWVTQSTRLGHLSKYNFFIMGLGIYMLGVICLFMAHWQWSQHFFSVMIPVFIATFGMGLALTAGMGIVLDHFGQHAGVASGLLGSCRYISAAPIVYLMGWLPHKSSLSLGFVMAGCCAIAFLGLYGCWSKKAVES